MAVLSGGDKLESALKEISSKLESGNTLQVGFFEGTNYPDGTSVAMVAAINEYGAPSRGQPPRPFFRTMIANKSPEWPEAIAGVLKRTDYDVKETLSITGENIKAQLQDSIINGGWAANKPSTLAQKHGTQPLIDTHLMLDSVNYKVI